MKRINLLKTPSRGTGLLDNLLTALPGGRVRFFAAGLIFAAAVIWQVSAGLRYQHLIIKEKRLLEKTQMEFNAVKNELDVLKVERQKFTREKERINKKIIILEASKQERVPWSKILQALAQATPDEVLLGSVTLDKAMAKISGMTFNNLIVSRFMTAVEESDYFDNTTFTYTEKAKRGEQNVMNFEIVSEVTPAKFILEKNPAVKK